MIKKFNIAPGVPLYGIPLQHGNNPYIILPFKKKVNVTIEHIEKSDKIKVDINVYIYDERDDVITEIYKSTLKDVLKYLDITLSIKTRINMNFTYSPLYIYDSIVPALIKVIFTLADIPLSRRDILTLLRAFNKINTPNEMNGLRNALRVYSFLRKPLIYREGEGYILLNSRDPEFIKRVISCTNVNYVQNCNVKYIENPLYNWIIHLHGRLTIEAANALREGDIEKVTILHRTETLLNLCLLDIGNKCVHRVRPFSKIIPDYNGVTLITLRSIEA